MLAAVTLNLTQEGLSIDHTRRHLRGSAKVADSFTGFFTSALSWLQANGLAERLTVDAQSSDPFPLDIAARRVICLRTRSTN